MFSVKQAKAYCCEPIEKIQGFKKASESLEKYHIHHRFEDMGLSRQDLIGMGLLYHRPACELIFIEGREHNRKHSMVDLSDAYKNALWKAGHIPDFTEEHRRHISEAKKGVKQTQEHIDHNREACRKTRASKEFKDKLKQAQARIWTEEKRKEHSATIKRVWETNVAYRENLKHKASINIHKDLDAYKQYKANGGELSWKPFRSMLAKQRKSK